MSLSSTSLFHYTKGGLEALTSILQTGFLVKHSPEIHPETMATFPNGDGLGIVFSHGDIGNSNLWPQTKYLNIPMVCFCDIRFSQISDHVKKYSNVQQDGTFKVYAIGLTKAWGRAKGLNPIQYLVAGGEYVKALSGAKIPGLQKPRVNVGTPDEREEYCPPVTMGVGYTIRDNKGNTFPKNFIFSKVIQASYMLPDGKTFAANFQDEKEWRYVPENGSIVESEVNRHPSIYSKLWDSIRVNSQRAIAESAPVGNLTFGAQDITHIIVSDDSEVVAIHKILKDTFTHLNDEELALLLSKVNSYDSLFGDI